MFSLKSLLLAVLVAAVFIVAFLNSSPIWASVIVTLTILLLAAASYSIYLLPKHRTFLIGAVVVGGIYLSVALIRPLGITDALITSRLLFNWQYATVQEELGRELTITGIDNSETMMYWLLNSTYNVGSMFSLNVINAFKAFQQIGHCAVALILAVIAGLVGSYVARKGQVNSP